MLYNFECSLYYLHTNTGVVTVTRVCIMQKLETPAGKCCKAENAEIIYNEFTAKFYLLFDTWLFNRWLFMIALFKDY